MGGGGSAQGMANSLKMNRGQLRKRPKMFSRESHYTKLNAAYNEDVKDYNATGAIAYKRRRKTRINNAKKVKTERILAISVAISISAIILWVFSSEPVQEDVFNDISLETTQLNYAEKEYLQFLTYGDSWLEDKKWKPAIIMYEKALEIYPNSFDAQYRLALAFSYSCVDLHINCFEGKELIEDLKKSNPDRQGELIQLDKIFSERNVDAVFIH